MFSLPRKNFIKSNIVVSDFSKALVRVIQIILYLKYDLLSEKLVFNLSFELSRGK